MATSPGLAMAGGPDASAPSLSIEPSARVALEQGSPCGASRCPLLHWIACGFTRSQVVTRFNHGPWDEQDEDDEVEAKDSRLWPMKIQ